MSVVQLDQLDAEDGVARELRPPSDGVGTGTTHHEAGYRPRFGRYVMPHRALHIPAIESGSYGVREGCAVRPLVDGEPAFRRICAAIEAARTSVFATVAFLEPGVQMPDRRGSIFDVLDATVARGLDVRVIFWRSEEISESAHFPGTDLQRAWLASRESTFGARWDALPEDQCHHQKSWLIDVETSDEVVFVGGINLDHPSLSPRRHASQPQGSVHDVYLELRGPAASDVHHNFVQRWNEASDHAQPGGHWPEGDDRGPLAFPRKPSERAGDAVVQISRTVQAGLYRDETPAPGGKAYRIENGEFSILDQYLAAIDAARNTIYIEDQAIGSLQIVGHLKQALERGVAVALLLPGDCHPAYWEARQDPQLTPYFDLVASLDDFPSFTMAAIASNDGAGSYHDIYVHAKIMLVDDAWATIGSANTVDRSFQSDTELNASIWHGDVVKALRADLFAEHLARDTAALSDVEAFHKFYERARDNAWRRLASLPLEGLAFQLNASLYGLGPPKRWIEPPAPG